MTTKHDVRVAEASVSASRFRAVCACSCGWRGDAVATSEPGALAEAGRRRVEHLTQAHPKQTPSAFVRPRAHARYRHPRSVSAATEGETGRRRWSRYVACACGWTDTVHGRSPEATAKAARSLHRAHVQLQTGWTPSRDYVVMAAVVLVVGAVLLAMAWVAITASGGEPDTLLR